MYFAICKGSRNISLYESVNTNKILVIIVFYPILICKMYRKLQRQFFVLNLFLYTKCYFQKQNSWSTVCINIFFCINIRIYKYIQYYSRETVYFSSNNTFYFKRNHRIFQCSSIMDHSLLPLFIIWFQQSVASRSPLLIYIIFFCFICQT